MFMGLYVINKKWTYLYTYTHTHTRTYCHQIHIWIHTYTRTYIYTYICTNVSHTCATNIRMYVHARIHTYIHTYTYKYTHTHLDTCIQTYALWCIMHKYTKHKYIHALQACICMLQTYIHTYIYINTHVYVYTYTHRHILHSLPYLSRHSTYVLPKIVRIHCIYILPQMSSLVVCMYIYMYICHQGPKKPFGHFLGFLISHSHICFDIAA